MTAHSNMQQDWIINKEAGLKTGLLIWDLSAAFDTLDIDLLCMKHPPQPNYPAHHTLPELHPKIILLSK